MCTAWFFGAVDDVDSAYDTLVSIETGVNDNKQREKWLNYDNLCQIWFRIGWGCVKMVLRF